MLVQAPSSSLSPSDDCHGSSATTGRDRAAASLRLPVAEGYHVVEIRLSPIYDQKNSVFIDCLRI